MIQHISSSMSVVLGKYGIHLSEGETKLMCGNASEQEFASFLQEFYESWAGGGKTVDDLKVNFTVYKQFILLDKEGRRLKIFKDFLKSLPRRRDARAFISHLQEDIDEIRATLTLVQQKLF